ncbi:MAG TPA: MBL fold metallo-hydrolase [Bacteriovoracaceae bacterium]|nr:MBL fold metallo-hydrolase [Bacteriovoracaceae bacterium]
MQLGQWEHAGLKFEGISIAGVRTCVTLPQHGLAFDIANGLPHAMGMNTFLLTHGHMDHSAGIPYVISQKAMNSHRPPRFIMPVPMVEPMHEIMRQWSKIEGHEYNFEFIGAKVGDEFPLKANLFIRAFPTIHRIPSLGYSIYRRFHKLRSDLIGIPGDEIAKMRLEGKDPTEERSELIVSFTGDTQIEFLDLSPEVRDSRILMLEMTYLDERKPISSAKEWGHTHLDELIPRLATISSEKIVLIHKSARYSPEEAQQILKRKLSSNDLDRVHFFGC